ncbi:MAG: hypothetical protein LKJ76_07420 [Lachnospiraceae bacterium]|jgi:hypothetical protein|nr:hypothetical protein [Lachnospiraceae bacterium]
MGLYGDERKNGKLSGFLNRDRPEKSWHSSYYHRFFEGYSEVKQKDEKGHEVILRIYTADYFQQDITDRQRMILRIQYVFACICAAACFIGGLITNVKSNTVTWIAFLGVVPVIGLIMLAAALAEYLLAPKKMKLYTKKSSSDAMQTALLVSMFGLLSCAVCKMIYMLMENRNDAFNESISAGLLVIAFLILFSMYKKEKSIHYTVIHNDTEIPENSSMM